MTGFVNWDVEPHGYQAIRLAGQVKRYHTVPGCDQTIAAHSWGVAVFLIWHFPKKITDALLMAALQHDMAEIYTGDIPANVKWDEPAIKTLLDAAENRWLEATFGSVSLYDEEHALLKLADQCELLSYCYEQRCLGNRFASRPFWRVMSRVSMDNRNDKVLETLNFMTAKMEQMDGYSFRADV